MEKFVTNEELRDILSELADNFMEEKRYDVTISLSHYITGDELRITVQDGNASYKTIANEAYKIIPALSDSFDISKNIKEAMRQNEADAQKETEELKDCA